MIIAAAGGAPKPWISLFFDNFFFPRVKLNAQSSIRNLQSIVGAELQALLDGAGFDPYLGFYHSVEYGRPGLALDLLEEFRHPLVDRLTLNLFNLGVLASQDFAPQAEGGIYLNTAGKKKYFVQYERMLGELTNTANPAGKPSSFRAAFQNQIANLREAIMQEVDYVPFS